MDDDPKIGAKKAAAATSPAKKRLKRALRENLKRRKSQARGRDDGAAAPFHGEFASLNDGSGEKPGE
jgi:hypothetical protein